jgi:hypothetical protein
MKERESFDAHRESLRTGLAEPARPPRQEGALRTYLAGFMYAESHHPVAESHHPVAEPHPAATGDEEPAQPDEEPAQPAG